MAYVHTSVNEMSKVYLATERRFNYTTPKTFLEQIKLYQNLLAKKRMELVAKIERLENGLMKLQSTASQVGRARVPEPSPTCARGGETSTTPGALCPAPRRKGSPHAVFHTELVFKCSAGFRWPPRCSLSFSVLPAHRGAP